MTTIADPTTPSNQAYSTELNKRPSQPQNVTMETVIGGECSFENPSQEEISIVKTQGSVSPSPNFITTHSKEADGMKRGAGDCQQFEDFVMSSGNFELTTKLTTEQSLKVEQITDDLEAAHAMKEAEQDEVFVVVELGGKEMTTGVQREAAEFGSRNVGNEGGVGHQQPTMNF